MTEELASRWSRLHASVAHCITVGSAPDDRNSSGMRCKNLGKEKDILSLIYFLLYLSVPYKIDDNFCNNQNRILLTKLM